MKQVVVVFSVIIFVVFLGESKAQRHEIGVFGGVPNLIADIGKTNYLQPIPESLNPDLLPYSVGLVYRFNINPMHGFRLNFNYNRVVFDDNDAREDYRFERSYTDKNNIIEGSILFEYNFFDFNDEVYFAHTPYAFVGGGVFMSKEREYAIFHDYNRDDDGNVITPTTQTDFYSRLSYDEKNVTNFSIPFGIGYKFKFDYNWVVFAEVGVRFTPTDKLDYSIADADKDFTLSISPDLASYSGDLNIAEEIVNRTNSFISSRQTGYLKSNDWYVVSGVGLTYTFGRPPCYCN